MLTKEVPYAGVQTNQRLLPLETNAISLTSARTIRYWLSAILCFYAILNLAYVFVTPIGEGPDELDHIRYVEHLVRFGSFAPISEPAGLPYTLEAKQPPAYYFINAGLMLLLGRGGQALAPDLQENPGFRSNGGSVEWYLHPPVAADLAPWTYIMRLTGLLMGAATILLIFAAAREVFTSPEQAPLALCATALAGLLPQFAFMSAVVNNDNFATLVGAAITYWLVRAVRRGADLRGAVVLGLLLGLALLSKVNNLVYVPIALLVLALPGSRALFSGVDKQRVARGTPGQFSTKELAAALGTRVVLGTSAIAICLAVGGWWYARNITVYGDLLAAHSVNQLTAAVIPTHVSNFDPAAPGALLTQLFIIIATHFAAFGWVVIKPPVVFYLIYMLLLLFSTVGLVAVLVRKGFNVTQRVQIMLAVLILGAFYGSMVYNSVGQGRLLFPALTATGMLIAGGTYGFLRLLTRNKPALTSAWVTLIVWVLFLGVASLYSLFGLVIPAYH